MIDLGKGIFPFNDEGMKHLFDRKISVFKMLSEKEFLKSNSIQLRENGRIDNFDDLKYWIIKNGTLVFENQQKETIIIIDNVKIIKNELYFVGNHFRDSSSLGFLFKEEKLLGDSNKKIGVMITSCKNYYQHTSSKIFRSLGKAGFEKEDMFLVICHARKNEHTTQDGYNYILTKGGSGDGKHFEAIYPYIKDYDYIYLIHDTCAVDDVFKKSLNKIDTSIKFDIHLAHKDFNIGLYDCEMIEKQIHSINTMNINEVGFNLKTLIQEEGFFTYLDTDATFQKQKAKDFYGLGIIRGSYYMFRSGIYKYFQESKTPKHKP